MARVINSNLRPAAAAPVGDLPAGADGAALPAAERRRRQALHARFASEPAATDPAREDAVAAGAVPADGTEISHGADAAAAAAAAAPARGSGG